MGGHGHGHEPPYKIPSPDIYKVEDVPELKHVQEELAKKGLKDPWLRNYVWRYARTKTRIPRGIIIATRGWRIAVPAFLLTISIEKYFGIDYEHFGRSHEHHGDSHHEDGHR